MGQSKVFDIYVIGEQSGFYVGQAVRRNGVCNGWERRINAHLQGQRSSSLAAHRLITAGASARRLVSFCSTRSYACDIEARVWDALRARGWHAVHRRPRDSNYCGTGGKIRSAEHRAKLSAALLGHVLSAETREKISKARGHDGRNFGPPSLATRAKISRALKGRRVGAALRGGSKG